MWAAEKSLIFMVPVSTPLSAHAVDPFTCLYPCLSHNFLENYSKLSLIVFKPPFIHAHSFSTGDLAAYFKKKTKNNR